MPRLKTIFFGTPEIAVPFLDLACQLTNVQLVVTQADRPRGRGLEILPCPVKERAQKLNLDVLSPEKLKTSFNDIAQIPFDVGIVVAYGKIFRPEFIALPRMGLINVHFSLLPQWRGAAPVQRALMNGDTMTGVSTFWINEGMDKGPLFVQKKLPIAPQDNAKTLFSKLTALGIVALQETIFCLERGEIIRTPQTGEATIAHMLQKEEGFLRPAFLTAEELHNRVRGLACGPKPKIPFWHKGETVWLRVRQTEIYPQEDASLPGTVLAVERNRGILVKCLKGSLWLKEVQPSGKSPMSGADFAHGRSLKKGAVVFIEG